MGAVALGPAAQRRLKKLRQKKQKALDLKEPAEIPSDPKPLPEGVEIEYVSAPLESTDPDFAVIFSKFQLPTETESDMQIDNEPDMQQNELEILSEPESLDMDEEMTIANMSKKKLRKLNRLTIAELKQMAKKPEVIEWEDVTAKDPLLLAQLKAYRNTIPVPRHWSQKRKYLAGKRGFVKPPFDLPAFIKDTGVTELRDAIRAKEVHKRQKVKAREKMHPKLGKMSVDYQRLYDAFFKYQTKPPLTTHGDLYYEGKEFEGKLRDKKPGHVSDELRFALGMSTLSPPPWIYNMQRYGLPPSYPHLKIPGLNAPIPDGAQWGFHPGGWGKPPVNDLNEPLYGDVFSKGPKKAINFVVEQPDRTIWGELEPEEEFEEEDEGTEEEEAKDAEQDMAIEEQKSVPVRPPQSQEPPKRPSGFVSQHEPEKILSTSHGTETVKPLYQVIPQREAKSGGGIMESQFTYDIGGSVALSKTVEVALNPEEVDEMDEAMLKAKLDDASATRSGKAPPPSRKGHRENREDLTDMIAEHAVKQEQRRNKQSENKSKKSSKEYKF